MGAIRNLFRRDERNEHEAPESERLSYSRQPEAIQYDSQLIGTLHKDHEGLLNTWSGIGDLLGKGRFDEIPDGLNRFKRELDHHLLTENVRFYNYVEQQLADDPVDIEIIRDFRQEMNGIARSVTGFIRKYMSSGVGTWNFNAFRKDYRAIGEALQNRIEREECDLYPLYTPPQR